MKERIMRRAVLAGAIITILWLQACKDEKPLSDNEYVNNWILANMDYYYYWNNDIPAKPNKQQPPDNFFYSILSDEDRFSWIQNNFEELLKSLSGVNKEAGYEFVLYLESKESQNVIALVVYVKPESPAATTDLKRGDVITHINGAQITVSNYQSLLGQISNNHTITFKRYNFDTEVFEVQPQLPLTVVEFAENPNHLYKVFDYPEASKKVGYYVYNFFGNGPTQSSTQYNDEMNAIFAYFKDQGITDLVLDLRYNSGGSETAAIKLASLIGKNINSNHLFTRWEYNDTYGPYLQNKYGTSVFERKFTNEANNIGSQLQQGKLYVLTRNRTASASELIINGLRPYMDVFIVGDTTVGKNVGSVTIYQNTSRNKWGMQPIIVKSFNKDGVSDYDEGFIPNIANKDNSLVILPLGDENENLLSLALAQITGSEGGRKKAAQMQPWGKMLGTSLDRKRKHFNILLDDPTISKPVITHSDAE
jgi:carboxyl-terminal processing protease